MGMRENREDKFLYICLILCMKTKYKQTTSHEKNVGTNRNMKKKKNQEFKLGTI